MVHKPKSRRMLMFMRVCLVTIGLFSLLILLNRMWVPTAAAADEINLTVLVDGRAVSVESVEAQLQGVTTTYTEVIRLLGADLVQAESVELFELPDTPIQVADVTAEIQDGKIRLTNLSRPLAERGKIGVWINGESWRICVVIVWSSRANLDVTVDGRQVEVEGVQAEVGGEASDLRRVFALLGDETIVAEKIEWFDPANPDTSQVISEGVEAKVRVGHLALSGLAPELAARGKIGIWVSTSKWRICVVIVWGSRANLDVSVDGRKVEVEGLEAQVNGEQTDIYRVLTLVGEQEILAETVEWFDPATPSNTKVLTEAKALLHNGHLQLTNLAPELAARGKIGIWVSTSRWRICVVIVWGSRANLDVSVDGRKVEVEGLEAQVNGEQTDIYRVLTLVGEQEILAETVEWFDPATPSNTKVLTETKALLHNGHLQLTNLAPELAARGKIGIWVSTSKWRICVVIVWGSRANLDVTVDGRQVQVEGIQAEVGGEASDLHRIFALLGDETVVAEKIEWFDPTNPDTTEVLSEGVEAKVRAGHLALSGLAPELAARGKIGIWVSTSKWRICVVIVWGSRANLDVTVDGREAEVEDIQAEVDGEKTELRRVLALIGDETVVAEKIEWFDPAEPSNTEVLSTGVEALVHNGHLKLNGLAPELAARGKIGIWVSTSRWRICVVIVWGSRANLDVTVDGRDVSVEDIQAEVDGEKTELRRVLALLGDETIVADKIEIFKPNALSASSVLTDPVMITPAEKITATVQGNRLRFDGLANTLAKHKRIGIWISGKRWRICIIIKLGSDNNPRVVVDGRPVLAYQPEAEFDGEKVDPRRVLAFLSEQEVTAEKIEIEANGEIITDADVTAVLKDGSIILTNLADTLEARGRISIWLSGKRWRICVTIEWGVLRSPDGQVNVDLPASDAHAGIKIDYAEVQTPSNSLPPGKREVILFTLDAENSLGAVVYQLDDTYTIEVSYTDEELEAAGINESTLTIYVYDEATGAWVAIPTEVDTVNNKAIGTLDHFSEFALLGDESTSSVDDTIFLPIIQR